MEVVICASQPTVAMQSASQLVLPVAIAVPIATQTNSKNCFYFCCDPHGHKEKQLNFISAVY